MRKILILFVLCSSAMAQLSHMEAIPTLLQSPINANALTKAYAVNVVSGNTLITAFHGQGTCATPSISDSLSTSYSLKGSITTLNLCLYVWVGTAPSSGANTVTITSALTVPEIQVQEWSNLSTTADGAATTANNNFVSNAANIPNITTTKYRDAVFNFVTCTSTDIIGPGFGTLYQPISGSGSGNALYSQWWLSGDPATLSNSVIDVNNRTCAEMALAMESTTSLAVSTKAIPDAVSGTAYNFQLHATGGVGTNTWSIQSGSLPSGLSLTSGGNITGTPTASNPNTITFKVTDSAAASATANLTIGVGTSFNTQVLANLATGAASTCGPGGFSVTSGNIITVSFAMQNDWFAAVPTDSVGTIYTTVPQVQAGLAAGNNRFIVRHYWGIAGGSGANTVTTIGNAVVCSEYTNTQDIFDTDATSILYSSAGGATITSTAITSPVAETLYATSGIGTTTGTDVINSPFTSDSAVVRLSVGHKIGAAAGSNTASWAVTSNTSNDWQAILFGIRPTKTGTAAAGLTPRHNPGVF